MNKRSPRLHRCWWRMLETKCVSDNFGMLLTVFAVFVTNILYLLHSNISVGHQLPKDVNNIEILSHAKIVTKIKSPTSPCHQLLFTRFPKLPRTCCPDEIWQFVSDNICFHVNISFCFLFKIFTSINCATIIMIFIHKMRSVSFDNSVCI